MLSPAQCGCKKGGGSQALGRSVGGLSTKIHTVCDASRSPTTFYLTGGEAHDLAGADVLLPDIQADAVLADKAYHAEERVIQVLEATGTVCVIPPKSNHVNPKAYDKELYKERNHIERFFQKLKEYRGIATRYDKTATCFLGGIYFVAIVLWLQ